MDRFSRPYKPIHETTRITRTKSDGNPPLEVQPTGEDSDPQTGELAHGLNYVRMDEELLKRARQRSFMTLVKICGITNLEDALCAVDAGAGALGFNFYSPSPRYIDPENVREIIERVPKRVLTVGVFVNEEPERLKSIANGAGVTALQLHGDESPEYCAELRDWYVIKVFSVGEDFDPSVAVDYPVKAVMIDARHKSLRGGTGLLSDWSVAKRIRELGKPLFLAGGLSPDNVREAITVVKPYAVDACSALEEKPGKKNQVRVAEFVRAVKVDE